MLERTSDAQVRTIGKPNELCLGIGKFKKYKSTHFVYPVMILVFRKWSQKCLELSVVQGQ